MRRRAVDLTGSETRCWVYRQVSLLFADVPDSLPALEDAEGPGHPEEGPLHPNGPRIYPRTREAIRCLVEAFRHQPREAIQADQARLFINAEEGVPAPPYASWYLDGTLLGPSSRWVAGQYGEQALEVADDAGEPADFIGTEMEYMYFLCRHALAARATADVAALDALADAEARFFEQHLNRWLPLFIRRIRSAATKGVYARLADLLETFCLEEEARLCGSQSAPASGDTIR